jgi:hypothetical protein
MSVSIPTHYDVDAHLSGTIGAGLSGTVGAALSGTLGPIGPITLAGIPDTFHIDVQHLPKIQIGLDPLTINPLTINPLNVNLGPVTLNPVTLNLAVTELPSIRAHLPANFRVGFSIFGFELFSMRLCGEAQVITEPYVPNPCERRAPPPP